MTPETPPTVPASPGPLDDELDLSAVLALYRGAIDADSPDAYEISDHLTAEINRRRAVTHPDGSLADLVRRFGGERYAEAVNGECGSYLDSLTSEVAAEELFAQILADRQRQADELAEARLELTTVHEAAAEATRLADVRRDMIDAYQRDGRALAEEIESLGAELEAQRRDHGRDLWTATQQARTELETARGQRRRALDACDRMMAGTLSPSYIVAEVRKALDWDPIADRPDGACGRSLSESWCPEHGHGTPPAPAMPTPGETEGPWTETPWPLSVVCPKCGAPERVWCTAASAVDSSHRIGNVHPERRAAARAEPPAETEEPPGDQAGAVRMPDYMVTYEAFWKPIVEPDGVLNRDQIARELSDYSVVMEEASKVYSELAGLSKPNTAAHHILAAAEERYAETYADFLCDRAYVSLEDGDEATSELLREIAEEWHAGSWDEHIKHRVTVPQIAESVPPAEVVVTYPRVSRCRGCGRTDGHRPACILQPQEDPAEADHPHEDPGDGRTECEVCGKWVFPVIHSCKGVPVTARAMARYAEPVPPSGLTSLGLTPAADLDMPTGLVSVATGEPPCVCGHAYAAHTDPTWASGRVTAYGAGCQCGRCSIYRRAVSVVTGDTQDDACICGHSLERDHNAAGGCTRTLYDGEWCPCVGDDEDAPSAIHTHTCHLCGAEFEDDDGVELREAINRHACPSATQGPGEDAEVGHA